MNLSFVFVLMVQTLSLPSGCQCDSGAGHHVQQQVGRIQPPCAHSSPQPFLPCGCFWGFVKESVFVIRCLKRVWLIVNGLRTFPL